MPETKEELADLLKKEFQEMPGSLHFQFTKYQETPVGSEGYCIFARIHVEFEESSRCFEMDTRFTGVAGLEKDGWKLLSLHMPTSNQVQEGSRNFSHCATADRQLPKCPLSPVPD
ncbi:MAG: nuclear transport factor 2 family protein [Lachnospiraceae bacterium]